MWAKSVLLSGVATIGLFAFECQAATIQSTLGPSPYDFGDVAVGDSDDIDFDVAWSEDGSDYDYYTSPAEGGTWVVGAFTISTGTCNVGFTSGIGGSPGGTCGFSVQFSPSSTTTFSTPLLELLRLTPTIFPFAGDEFDALNGEGSASYIASFTGRGVAPVPIPAALPLLATGLGALGVMGWRRKRKLAQA